jgi:uncharacterized membrane protein
VGEKTLFQVTVLLFVSMHVVKVKTGKKTLFQVTVLLFVSMHIVKVKTGEKTIPSNCSPVS